MDSVSGQRWTNSWLGRLLNSALGAFAVGGGLWRAVSHSGWRPLDVVAASGLLILAGTILLAMTWTECLAVEDGRLVAHHFWGERSIALSDIASVEAPIGITGILVRSRDGDRLRSWASRRQGNELWTARAEKVAQEVLACVYETQGRPRAESAPDQAPASPVLVGDADGSRFTLVRWREGYDIADVDAFLNLASSSTLTSSQVENVQFRPVRLRFGYDMGQVDNYLLAMERKLRSEGR